MTAWARLIRPSGHANELHGLSSRHGCRQCRRISQTDVLEAKITSRRAMKRGSSPGGDHRGPGSAELLARPSPEST